MDYLITMVDGSQALAHHGVKGMKWGVWNAETAARYGQKSSGGGGGVDDTDKIKYKDLNYNDEHPPKTEDEINEALREVGYSDDEISKFRNNMDRMDAWFDRLDKIKKQKDSTSSGKTVGSSTVLGDELEDTRKDHQLSISELQERERKKALNHSDGFSGYRLTFQDGSSAYLAHHGVKGMQWGVWNAETAERYLGGQRSKKTQKLYDKRDKTLGRLRKVNENAEYRKDPCDPRGMKSYASASDSRKANRYLLKSLALDRKIYEQDARDAGIKPDKTMSKNINIGMYSIKDGLKDNEKRVKAKLREERRQSLLQEHQNARPNALQNKSVSDDDASKAAAIISSFDEKKSRGNVSMKDYLDLYKALSKLQDDD